MSLPFADFLIVYPPPGNRKRTPSKKRLKRDQERASAAKIPNKCDEKRWALLEKAAQAATIQNVTMTSSSRAQTQLL
jgi:hypothetical protein